jgi:hypothetical protein
MFCPQCRSEYLQGIRECVDCQIPLVDVLPPEPDHATEDLYVRILSTYNAADVAIVKSILDDAQIDYYFANEGFNGVSPLIQPEVLFVLKEQEEEAREALRDVDLRYMGLTARE